MDVSAGRTKPLLICTTSLFGLLLLPSFVLAPFAGFLYDEPGGGGVARAIFVAAWIGFWLVCAASIIASWAFYKAGKYRVARWIALLPVLDIAVGIVAGAFFFD